MTTSGCLITKKSRTGISYAFPLLASKFSSYIKRTGFPEPVDFLYLLTPFFFLSCRNCFSSLGSNWYHLSDFKDFPPNFLNVSLRASRVSYTCVLSCCPVNHACFILTWCILHQSLASVMSWGVCWVACQRFLCLIKLMAQTHSSQCKCYLSNVKNSIE